MSSDFSESGAPIYRHELHQRDFDLTPRDENARVTILEHVTRYVGKIDAVFQETVSDLVHVDVHIVKPTPQRDYYTLITAGMSDRPMNAPEEIADLAYAELLVCLPAHWPISEEAFRDENYYWPIRWLKLLARFPHEFQTWLFEGHTIPNQDPPRPFADNTEFSAILLAKPVLFGDEFPTIRIRPKKTVHVLSLLPLYAEELDYKLKYGYEELLDRFADIGLTEFLDLNRGNAG